MYVRALLVSLIVKMLGKQVTALATAEFYGQYSFEPEVGPKPHGKEGRGPQPTPLDELVSGAAIEAARARAAEEVRARPRVLSRPRAMNPRV